ncbi:MAG: DUF22 domain-containing protein [Methanosarcinaceae archaeon]|nr:DUF22 domain-containing protein [Methanosarcinaceae archaeon]MDF1534585.1 DUF22 domain-containing protein [Methanosarcinaceae archaeon]
MSTQIVQVVSRTNGELKSQKVEASPYEFTMATRAKWEMVVSDEDVEIRAGEFKKINVKEIQLQKDMLATPCAFSHHAIASVLKVGSKYGNSLIENDRIIKYAYIIGQETGKVRSGDLLAVLNIFPIMFTREATIPVKV